MCGGAMASPTGHGPVGCVVSSCMELTGAVTPGALICEKLEAPCVQAAQRCDESNLKCDLPQVPRSPCWSCMQLGMCRSYRRYRDALLKHTRLPELPSTISSGCLETPSSRSFVLCPLPFVIWPPSLPGEPMKPTDGYETEERTHGDVRQANRRRAC